MVQFLLTCHNKCYCLILAYDTVCEQEIPELSTLLEDADTKVFSCIKYVNESGFNKTVIHTVDTNVVALGLYYLAFIDCRIFIHLGCGSKKQLLELKNAELSRKLCMALPGLHALTWCNSTVLEKLSARSCPCMCRACKSSLTYTKKCACKLFLS